MAKADTKQVKNISGQTVTLVGYGQVKPEQTIEVTVDFRVAGFEEVTETVKQGKGATKTEPKESA